MSLSRTRLNMYALFAIVCVLGSLWFMYVARENSVRDNGPRTLVSDSKGQVYVVAGNELLYLGQNGELLARFALADFDVGDAITGLQVLADDSLLMGSYQHGNIYRCKLEENSCEPVLHRNGDSSRIFKNVFHFSADEQAGHIYVTNSSVHRLEKFTLAGKFVNHTRGDAPEFCYPNSLQVMDNGQLAIADTNNHRIVIVDGQTLFGRTMQSVPVARGNFSNRRCSDVSGKILPGKGDRFLAREIDFSSESLPTTPHHGRGGRIWPLDMTLDNAGRWWVINSDNNLRHADVMVFDSEGVPLKRVVLHNDEQADPVAILAVGGQVLIADPVQVRLFTASFEDSTARQFGDPEVQQYFADLREEKRLYFWLYRLAMALFVFSLVAVVVVVALDMRLRSSTGE